ncbi:hypothetical protein ACXYUI_30715, partial [Klebsiella pneumoniae]
SDAASFYRLEARLVISGAPVAQTSASELFDKWVQIFSGVMQQEGGTIALLAQHEEQSERIVNLLDHRGLKPVVRKHLLDDFLA